jgi:predicted CopG family antitoxin
VGSDRRDEIFMTRLNINININMSKTITIRKAVYDELLMAKKKNESFSELLDRLVKSEDKKQLLESLRGSITFSDKKAMLKEIKESRWEKR